MGTKVNITIENSSHDKIGFAFCIYICGMWNVECGRVSRAKYRAQHNESKPTLSQITFDTQLKIALYLPFGLKKGHTPIHVCWEYPVENRKETMTLNAQSVLSLRFGFEFNFPLICQSDFVAKKSFSRFS